MIKKSISLFIFGVFAWMIWSFSGRYQPLPPIDSFLTEIQEINPSDSLNRSIIGIQPYMLATDYFSQPLFKEKMGMYLQEAKKHDFFKKKSVVLFPEYIGTWLVLEGEKHALASQKTLNQAMTILVISNLFELATALPFVGQAQDLAAAAIFKMKARKMAKSYFQTFSELAKEYQIHIVAGSIVLPGPRVEDGLLVIDQKKPLNNVSFVFGPDGKIVGAPIIKAFPIASERPFVAESDPKMIPTFDLPIGKTSVLICADSWFPEAYHTAKNEEAEVILVPSYCTGDGSMDQVWKGYSGYPAPNGTALEDINRLSEAQAWEKYALPGRINSTPAQVGMNVFLRGELWELGTDGQPLVLYRGALIPVNPAKKAGIWSLNF